MAHIFYNSFEDAINASTGERNCLVGNGMSMAFDSNLFSYDSLLKTANFAENDPIIESVFQSLKTTDFESVANALINTQTIAQTFAQNDFAVQLGQAIELLKSSLISSVSDNHPKNKNNVTDDQALKCQQFFKNFTDTKGVVFSLNYDLLIYWSILRKTPINTQLNVSDGFGFYDNNYVCFQGDAAPKVPNFLFPHGTLFFFEKAGKVLKPKAAAFGKEIIEIIKSHLNNGMFPIFVSEGSSAQKFARIRQNHYLNYCFDRIDTCKDDFYIFGHSLKWESDSHILLKIAQNKNIKRLFASYFGGEAERDVIIGNLHHIKGKSERTDLEICTYPAATVQCWTQI